MLCVHAVNASLEANGAQEEVTEDAEVAVGVAVGAGLAATAAQLFATNMLPSTTIAETISTDVDTQTRDAARWSHTCQERSLPDVRSRSGHILAYKNINSRSE